MTVPTRFARPEEMAEVQALVRAAYTPWIDIIGAEPGPMHDDYASKIAAKQVHVMADHDTGIFACKVLIPMTNVVLLDNIAIRPDMQGKGWGRRMMESSEFIARHYGFTRMRLYTHAKMTSNIAIVAARPQGIFILTHMNCTTGTMMMVKIGARTRIGMTCWNRTSIPATIIITPRATSALVATPHFGDSSCRSII